MSSSAVNTISQSSSSGSAEFSHQSFYNIIESLTDSNLSDDEKLKYVQDLSLNYEVNTFYLIKFFVLFEIF